MICKKCKTNYFGQTQYKKKDSVDRLRTRQVVVVAAGDALPAVPDQTRFRDQSFFVFGWENGDGWITKQKKKRNGKVCPVPLLFFVWHYWKNPFSESHVPELQPSSRLW